MNTLFLDWTKNMIFSFSWQALIVIALAMLPNAVYFLKPPADIPTRTNKAVKAAEIIENISRFMAFALMLFLAKIPTASFRSPWLMGMAFFLILYWALWGRFFFGGGTYALLEKSLLGIPLPMAIFPVGYFICAAFWLDCFPAVVAWCVFFVAHIVALSKPVRVQ